MNSNLDNSTNNITEFEANFNINNINNVNYNSYNNVNKNEDKNNDINYSNNYKDVIHSQRKTIINLAHKYKKIEFALFTFKKDNYEKENNFNTYNKMKIKEYDNLTQSYEEKIATITKEYEDYKIKALEDFAYKEKKLMDLINKNSDLEDEIFRIIHNNKDTDKKKYLLMEIKTKDLTLELQRVFIKFFINLIIIFYYKFSLNFIL